MSLPDDVVRALTLLGTRDSWWLAALLKKIDKPTLRCVMRLRYVEARVWLPKEQQEYEHEKKGDKWRVPVTNGRGHFGAIGSDEIANLLEGKYPRADLVEVRLSPDGHREAVMSSEHVCPARPEVTDAFMPARPPVTKRDAAQTSVRRKCKPCEERAYRQYMAASADKGKALTLREAYNYTRLHGDDADDTKRLPKYETWAHHYRAGARAHQTDPASNG